MKNKNTIVGIVISLLIIVICVFLLPGELGSIGSMSRSSSKPVTSTSCITFAGEEDDRIRISLKSDIKGGQLKIRVQDAAGNEVCQLEPDRELESYVTFEKADVYTLEAKYTDFVGKCKLVVYAVD